MNILFYIMTSIIAIISIISVIRMLHETYLYKKSLVLETNISEAIFKNPFKTVFKRIIMSIFQFFNRANGYYPMDIISINKEYLRSTGNNYNISNDITSLLNVLKFSNGKLLAGEKKYYYLHELIIENFLCDNVNWYMFDNEAPQGKPCGIEDFTLKSLHMRGNKSPAPPVLTAPRGAVLNRRGLRPNKIELLLNFNFARASAENAFCKPLACKRQDLLRNLWSFARGLISRNKIKKILLDQDNFDYSLTKYNDEQYYDNDSIDDLKMKLLYINHLLEMLYMNDKIYRSKITDEAINRINEGIEVMIKEQILYKFIFRGNHKSHE